MALDKQNNDKTQQADEALMLTYAQGDISAFDLLYQRHKLALYRFYLRQPLAQAIAEELCHDTWLKVINSRASYQVTALFRTYLFTIARRVYIDYQQKKSTQNEQERLDKVNDSHLFVGDDKPEKALRQGVLLKVLKSQIAALPEKQREIFLLKQESGFSLEQVADITGQGKEQVKSSWRYALQKLRKGLSSYVN